MPAPADHFAWAEKHFLASERIGKSTLYSWQTVSLFYAAMQLAHVGLGALPELPFPEAHPDVHRGAAGTNTVLARHAPAPVPGAYLDLFSASVDVRYKGRDITAKEAEHFRYTRLPPIGIWACETFHADPRCECWVRAKL